MRWIGHRQVVLLLAAGLVSVGVAGLASARELLPTATSQAPTCDGKPATIIGASGNSTTSGTSGDDVIVDLSGNNRVDARQGGNDTVCTGPGIDEILTSGGNDTIDAGENRNTVNSAGGNDKITTGSGIDKVNGGAGNDTIGAGGGTNAVTSGGGDDKVTTGAGNDTITGDAGKDVINAGDGKNNVKGGAGDDTLFAGSGNDKLDGGTNTTASPGDACNADGGTNTVINCESSPDSPPSVTSTSPSDGATQVATDANITINFSEQVNYSSSSFDILCGSFTHPPFTVTTVSPGTSATLDPSSDIPPGVSCTVTVFASQITDTDAVDPPDNMTADYSFSFTADTPPAVTTTTPADNATGVDPSADITVNFNEAVDVTTSSFTIDCPGSQAFSVSGSGSSSITLNPNSDLPSTSTCTVTAVAASISDTDTGDPPDHPSSDTSFSFTTQDAAPTVTSTTPADNDTGVATNSTVTVNFSEQVSVDSGAFKLECPTGTPIAFSQSSSPASSYTLTPSSNLPDATVCTVTVTATKVHDTDAVDPPDTMASDYVFSFSTADSAPSVTSTTPGDGDTVATDVTVTIDFSEPVSVDSGAFKLECPTGTPVAFSQSSSPASSYTLTPSSDLPEDTTCTVTVVATKVHDTDTVDPPDNLAADYVFSFTTDAAPTVTGTTPADTATDVNETTNIAIDFSEAVDAAGSAFAIECPTGNSETFVLSGSGTSTITLNPDSDLPFDTVCTVTVTASGVSDSDTLDPPDDMAADYVFSFKVRNPPPDAVDDGPSADYSATGGVSIDIDSSIGVTQNDTLFGGSITGYGASTGTEETTLGTPTATAQGGFVALNADGSFHYEPPSIPPAGGTDSFKYTLTNGGGSDTATVTLNVTNQIVFVDASASSSPETGSIEHPYNSLGDVPSTRNTGGVLFFYSGTYTRSDADGVTLKSSEYLIGQGVALSSNLPFTLAPHSVSLPGSSTNPTIGTSVVSGNAISLGSGNTVKGLTAAAAPGASISGSSFGTLTIANASINNSSTGAALSLGTGAFGAGSSIDSLTASPTSVSQGVALLNVTGSVALSAGSIAANSSGDAFIVSGGSVSVTDSGSVSQAGAGALLSVLGGHTGTLIFQTGTLGATNGTGLLFQNADGTYTLSNGSTLNGGDAGVDVTSGSSGTMTLNNSPITNPTGTAFNVNGSSATVSDSGAISKTSAGGLITIISNTGGSVTLSGNLSSTGSAQGVGILLNSGGTYTFSGTTKTIDTSSAGSGALGLTSNTGSTINFTNGGLALTTAALPAFSATGGGTVNVTGTGNTITSTTGTPLDIESTTIGSSNVTFESVTSNGGTHGIVLISTGSSGHLAVTGTGTAGSGGSITGITGADAATNNCGDLGTSAPVGVGVYLKSTTAPSLAYMSFPGTFGNFGILGYSVSGFTLDNTTMTGTYGDNVNSDDDTVHFCTLTGSATISNSTISNGAESNLRVVNPSGTLNRLTLQSDTFGLNQTGGGGSVLLQAGTDPTTNTGTLNATVKDTTFQGSRGSPFIAATLPGTSMDLVFGAPSHGNTVHNTHSNIVSFTQNLIVAVEGTVTFDVNSNHFDTAAAVQAQGGVLINSALGTGIASGYFRNNTIGTSGVTDSGSSGGMPALDVESNGGGDLTIKVDNNQLYQWGANGAGFLLQAGATGVNPVTFNATVTNNTIAQPGTFAVASTAQGFQLNNGTNSGENFTTCLLFSGNVFDASGTGAGGDGRFRQRFDTKVNLPGYTGADDGTTGSPTVASYIQGLNPTGPPTITSVSSTAGPGGFFNTPGGAPCAVPSF